MLKKQKKSNQNINLQAIEVRSTTNFILSTPDYCCHNTSYIKHNMLGEELFIQDIFNNGALNEDTSLKWWKQPATYQLFTGLVSFASRDYCHHLVLFAQNKQINQVLKKQKQYIYFSHE